MNVDDSVRYRGTVERDFLSRRDVAIPNDYELWHPLALAVSCFLAAFMVVTWLFSPGRELWDRFDVAAFRQFNGTLEWGSAWQSVWAVANWRPFDMVLGLVLITILIATVRTRFAGRPLHGIASLAILAIGTLATQHLVSEVIVDQMLGYHRRSPTLVLENTFELNSLVGWIECKDRSAWSFPGDHGICLLMSALFVTYLGTKPATLTVWGVTLFGVMPRLISGAHWSTDILVGSGTTALILSAFLFATPLHEYLLSFVPAGTSLGRNAFSELETESRPVRAPKQRAPKHRARVAEAPVAEAPPQPTIRRRKAA